MTAIATVITTSDWVLRFLAARAVPRVEVVEGHTYRRSVRGVGVGVAALTAHDDPLARRVFGLDAAVEAADAVLTRDPALRRCVAAAPGRRVPGCVDPAEIAIRAVLGQQVSVAGARTLAARLALRHGEPVQGGGEITRLFPSPAALAALDPAELPMPRARGRALVTLCEALAGGLDAGDREAMLALPGIGPWTADYVAMRCGDPDVLLETDLGVRRGAAALGLPDAPRALLAHAERWRPWRSFAVQHLWGAA